MSEYLIATARYIVENCEQKLALSFLARRAFMSSSHFQKKFKSFFGVSPKEFQTFCRTKNFKNTLKATDNIIDAIFSAGFGSSSRVYGENDKLGINPSTYKKGGMNEEIYFHIASSKDFKILMAASSKGVCAVEIGDDEGKLIAALENEFPNASFIIAKESHELRLWVEALTNYLNRIAPKPEIPLDIRGTIFEQKVWQFLIDFPNENTSYGKIATALNMPKSARAVANAVGGNKIAILIPCHKVLRADGGLGGYKWGVEIKRKLIDAGV